MRSALLKRRRDTRTTRRRQAGIASVATVGAALILILALGCCVTERKSQDSSRLVVSAAVSLREALQEIAGLYRQRQTRSSITYNFAGSGTLQRQIEQGAPVDVFVSASPREMDALQAKGLVMTATRRNIAANEVVLIVPRNSHAVSGFDDLAAPGVKRIALGEPASVPAGKYAQETLRSLNQWDQLQPKLVFAQDVRQVLGFVATGNADAGLVYRTDAQITDQVKLVAAASQSLHSPIVYPAAVLKSSNDPELAEQFVKFLVTSEAQAVLARHGFARPLEPGP